MNDLLCVRCAKRPRDKGMVCTPCHFEAWRRKRKIKDGMREVGQALGAIRQNKGERNLWE